jgi:hypothetical protein
MVVAPVAPDRESDLRALLGSMNSAPGVVDPRNAVLPLGEFERLHFARLVLLDDTTMLDLEAYGLPVSRLPTYLAFIGDCDGPSRECLADLARRAGAGLRQIFSHCEGFDAQSDLLAWLLAHDLPAAASYVNWVGRTVRQVKEESALQRALAAKVSREPVASGAEAQQQRRDLIAFVQAEVRAGRLELTPPDPTPPGWKLANIVHLIGVPLAGLVALPFVIVLLPLLIFQLRTRETSDPEFCPRPAADAVRAMQAIEDQDVTNQFTALGPVKPGRFRLGLVIVLLVLIDYTCRHIFTRGYLARVQSIHFARWVFLDGKTRVLFASNYDGSHEAYMDDFINKVAWGLNLVFSNGFGWPRTDWLIKGGARREQLFKYYQRRHQLPSQVWYKAYPGLTAVDLARNQRIRAGLERTDMRDEEALAWLREL